MNNCICKIYLGNEEVGIGFLCKIPLNNNLLPVLFINNQILNNLGHNIIIKLIINKEVKKIKIDNSRKRYINYDKNMNIAIIEIKPNKDKIYNYLEIDENEISKNEKNLEIEHKNIYYILSK